MLIEKYQARVGPQPPAPYQDLRTVTGGWARARDEWAKRLEYLPAREQRALLRRITKGENLPWDRAPPKRLHARSNHPDLWQKPVEVTKTIMEQLHEGAIRPFDTKGGTALPRVVSAIRWVEKTGSDRVRITINLRPLNEFFPKASSAIQLETLHSQRNLFGNKWMIGFDQHSSYYQHMYSDAAMKYLGFRVNDSEITAEAREYLQRNHPECRKANSWVFTYKGLAMGCAPSCRQYSEPMLALVESWRRCKLTNSTPWRATSYIDDSAFLVPLDGFSSAIELSLRLLCEQIMLGFSVNFEKSNILPRLHMTHLGIRASAKTQRFSLPPKRVQKLQVSVARLRHSVTEAHESKLVQARLVAKVIGSLWAIHVVAHRAVAVMCRSMIDTLAICLRRRDLREEKNLRKLKVLLRQVWSGTVTWSDAADKELEFWEGVDFGTLSAPMSFDAVTEDLQRWMARPGKEAVTPKTGLRILAADTSSAATGAGEFVVTENGYECLRTMSVRLSTAGLAQSSTFRELEGVLKTLHLVRLRPGDRVTFLCDNQATVQVVKRGSGLPPMQALAAAIFKLALTRGCVLFPVWVRRTHEIIQHCDEGGRWVDNCDMCLPSSVFHAPTLRTPSSLLFRNLI